MAKEQVAEVLSPLAVCSGAIVAARAGQRVAAVQNYVAGRRPRVHFSMGPSVLAGVTQPPCELDIPASGTTTMLVSRVYLRPDFESLTFGLEANVASAGTTVRATIRAGAAAAVSIDATSTENGTEQTDTILIADTGTGWVDVEVDLTRVSGAALGEVRYISLQDTPITVAADLPDPENS